MLPGFIGKSEQGFTGKYTIFKDYNWAARPNASVRSVFRFETKPGVQAQVDWAECGHGTI